MSESDLRETYLPAFRDLVVDGKARVGDVRLQRASAASPPAAATSCSTKILREEWGFTGYVVSDCGAVHRHLREPQGRARRRPRARRWRSSPARDLECGGGSWAPGSPDAFLALGDAVKQGLVTEADLDRALRRLFARPVPARRLRPAGAAAVGAATPTRRRRLAAAPRAGARGGARVDRPAEERAAAPSR